MSLEEHELEQLRKEELLANYEQRLTDSGHDLTEPTRKQLEKKIIELRTQLHIRKGIQLMKLYPENL
tara:strand:- start:285 stop:485 length:201 start_codon:yes stop_codon:yes gene_type:complete